jgi:hypothetical protein
MRLNSQNVFEHKHTHNKLRSAGFVVAAIIACPSLGRHSILVLRDTAEALEWQTGCHRNEIASGALSCSNLPKTGQK